MPAQKLISIDQTPASSAIAPAQATITANPVISNPPYLYSQYPVALDLHDTVLERDYSIATNTMLKKASWSDLGCFLWGVICYGVERKILRRKTPNIENYLLASNITQNPDTTDTATTSQKSLTLAQIAANQTYEQHVVNTISCFKPMAGAKEFLQAIKTQGHPIFAFSNIGHKSFDLLAQKYPQLMCEFNGRVIIEDHTTPDKSDPKAYQRCLDIVRQTTGTAPERIIFYDDSPGKLAAAEKFRAETETASRFIPILCEPGSSAQIAASRAKVSAKLAELRGEFADLK